MSRALKVVWSLLHKVFAEREGMRAVVLLKFRKKILIFNAAIYNG